MSPDKEIDFCLLIPCYNNLTGLLASLKSVEYPSAKYLVVIVDDGSREPISADSIRKVLGDKVPFTIVRNEKNTGITAALNNGLKWIMHNAEAKYIARLDCGDTCNAERFSLQVAYLDAHAEVGLVGSWCRFEDKINSEGYIYKAPAEHKEIVREMYFRNVFIHPTIMFRSDLLESAGLYPTEFDYAEDYAFCWKLIKLKQSFVFQQVLVCCEINKSGLSFSNKSKQLKSRWKVVNKFGSYKSFKIIGLLRLCLLFLLPKELILLLKKSVSRASA